ncbi:MAG TPA: YcjF family protein [Pseudolabrys sp.]
MKKQLPKAIQPDIAHRIGSHADLISEPVPEPKRRSRPARPGTAAAMGPVDNAPIDERRAYARKLVERFSLWAGAAGLLPIPVADLAAVAGLQIQMLRRLSQVYDVPFSRHRGKALLAGFAGTMIPASTGVGMASLIKSVPIAGSAIGVMTTPALAVAATYVIGLAFIEHFASGGTLLDFDPPDYQEFIKRGMELRKT